MLDVHPINEPVHGWRDFFIHIATIVVGLCIAVAIEQTVEFFHNQHQLAEIRQALRLEREANYKTLAENTTAWRWVIAELQNNLLVLQYLQQHPGTPQEKLPGVLLWATSNYSFASIVWDAARQSGVLAHMPREEIERHFHDESRAGISRFPRYGEGSDGGRLDPAATGNRIRRTDLPPTWRFERPTSAPAPARSSCR